MRGLSNLWLMRTFLTLGPFEKDTGFRALLEQIARRGTLIAGIMGTVAVIIYTATYVFLIEKVVVWSYAGMNPRLEMVLIDKGLILLLSLTAIGMSRYPFSLTRSRLMIGLMVLVVSVAMVLDDMAARALSVTPAYISIALILALGTIPYKGWQAALLSLSVIAVTLSIVFGLPGLMDWPVVRLQPSEIIYLFLLAILLSGMSSQLYLNRYEQYRARREAEELSEQLEERARTLEMMKEKSERQAEQILEHEKLKDRFFTNISHEFRTPLTLLLGPLEDMLATGRDGDRLSVDVSMLQMMRQNGERLLQLINQLLDLSKIDAGQIKLNVKRVDAAKVARDTTLSFASHAERKSLQLSYPDDDEKAWIRADPQQLERAVNNLVANAVKFTPDGGSITVRVEHGDEEEDPVLIRVIDTGPGISPEEQEHVFDRFYQASRPEGMLTPGTGIGLSLAKEIIELHGGTLTVKSEPGRGSEFVVSLWDKPAIRDAALTVDGESGGKAISSDIHPDDTAREMEWPAKPPEGAPRLLVVDDNPDILAYLSQFLGRRYNVTTCEGGEEALKLIQREPMELVICDVRMPPPDGFELCRVIKEDAKTSHIPVILLTARATEESRIEGLKLGADDYISKPFSASELMVRVENLIELRRVLRDKFSRELQIKGGEVEVSSDDARFLERVQAAIEQHMQDSNFGVDWLADEMNLSTRQLQRKIQAVTNISAGGYIRLLRLERAGQLLSKGWGNVSEVAWKVGFRDVKYFSRLFKQTFGKTPSDFAGS